MAKVRKVQEVVPDWATPKAWAETERIVNLAERRYRLMPSVVRNELERDHTGEYIVIASYLPLRYVVAAKEQDADKAFKKKFPRVRSTALVRIGDL